VDTFRTKKIPIDAVIYLGTGFTPRGWNKKQPSFEFNPDVFTGIHLLLSQICITKNVKVVLHMVPWDRDKITFACMAAYQPNQ
jgi:alpha-glucosidase/alpha-D-xyloside xylohydrolase